MLSWPRAGVAVTSLCDISLNCPRPAAYCLQLLGCAAHWPLLRITVKGGTIGRVNARGEGAGGGRMKVGFSSSPSSPASRPYQATTYVGTF